jgi:hypothetical protein
MCCRVFTNTATQNPEAPCFDGAPQRKLIREVILTFAKVHEAAKTGAED